jgi:hypothetical protein
MFKPVANGLGTDHPIPDLPFVDDSGLPAEPGAIEAIGRKEGGTTWGREDSTPDGGWVAFTTDPVRKDLAWFVRFHPEHGRSVMLVRDDDAASQHQVFAFEMREALLFRTGGYWWDGAGWFRPAQIWDRATERVVARPAPGAITVSAADVLDPGADASRARVLTVAEFDVEALASRHWLDDLALWAQRRRSTRPLSQCVVRLSAPELTGDQLIGTSEMAQLAGIAASTLRAYSVRGEGEIPEPQAVVGGRNLWSRPVAAEWAEQRKQSWESVTDAVSVDHTGVPMPVGKSELWTRFSTILFSRLWTAPGMRQRWALRWRTEAQVRKVAEDLGWSVATNLNNIVPTDALALTIRHAMLDEIARGQQVARDIAETQRRRGATGKTSTENRAFYGITPKVAEMLGWLVRHEPGHAQATIAEIIGEAENRFEVPRPVTVNTIRTALSLDGGLDREALREYLDRALPTAE